MKKLIVLFIVFFILLIPSSQAVVFEKSKSVEIVNGNVSITLFKNLPLVEISENKTMFGFYISSMIQNGMHIKMRNILWNVNFTKLSSGIYSYRLFSVFHGNRIEINFIYINNVNYLNYSGNGIIVHILIHGNSSSVVVFEHLYRGDINPLNVEQHDVFKGMKQMKSQSLQKLNYYAKNQTFYVSSSNGTETDLYQILPEENGTAQAYSFISIAAAPSSMNFNFQDIGFVMAGAIIGGLFLLTGLIYQRKKG